MTRTLNLRGKMSYGMSCVALIFATLKYVTVDSSPKYLISSTNHAIPTHTNNYVCAITRLELKTTHDTPLNHYTYYLIFVVITSYNIRLDTSIIVLNVRPWILNTINHLLVDCNIKLKTLNKISHFNYYLVVLK